MQSHVSEACACMGEIGCCILFGFPCIFCFHPCIAEAIIRHKYRKYDLVSYIIF